LELKLGFKAGLSQSRPFSRRQPLPGIISSNRISAPDSNIFDCAALAVFLLGHRINPLFRNAWADPMFFEAVAAFFLILSVGILVAHALDAYRS